MTLAEDLFAPHPRCGADGGCSYLREISKVERLIGCDPTAKFYERTAERCSDEGCWALLLHLRQASLADRPRRLSFPLKANRPSSKAKSSGGRERPALVVPLVRLDVADVVSNEQGDFVERRAVKFDILDHSEPLGYMRDYWKWLHSMTRCRLSNVDTMHLMRAGIIGRLHIVDVSSADPEDFRFELLGYGVPLGVYEKPRQFPSSLYAEAVLRDYNTARLIAVPRLQRVRAQLGSVYYNYLRLMLPLFDKRQRVSRLLVAIRRELDDGTILEGRSEDSSTT